VAANLSSRELPAPLSPGAASQSGRRAPRLIVHLAVGNRHQRWLARIVEHVKLVWLTSPDGAARCWVMPVLTCKHEQVQVLSGQQGGREGVGLLGKLSCHAAVLRREPGALQGAVPSPVRARGDPERSAAAETTSRGRVRDIVSLNCTSLESHAHPARLGRMGLRDGSDA